MNKIHWKPVLGILLASLGAFGDPVTFAFDRTTGLHNIQLRFPQPIEKGCPT
jgi:hypothetical protein